LTNLGLDENQLSGEIPPSLGNLSQLQVLYLDVNQLSGNIPSALGDLSQLQALYLDDNDLSGEVPDFTNFTGVYIHLGYNRLDTATGSQSLANIFAMISAGNTVYYSPENGPLGTGSVQVNITPSAAIAAGAKWQGDAGSLENSGVTVAHLVAGSHTISFTPVTGWTPPANQTVTVANGQTTTLTAAYMQQFGSLYVTLTLPPGVTAGAWRVDGGAFHGSGYEVNYLTVGNHLVSFQPVNDYLTPANQTVFVVNNSTTFVAGTYVTNAYLAAQGDYVGLFVSTNSAVEPANSGYININLTTMGAFSGKLSLGSIATPFSLTGQLSLSPDGTIAISDMQVQVRKSEFLDVYLQLNTETGASEPSAPALSGFVNAFTDSTETNALWASEISAELSVPSNNLISNGLYNVTIAPVSADPSQGPGGYGYASATVAKNGAVALVLDLADGASPATSFSSHLAQDGTCPFYASLYGGNGIILGWLKFDLNGDGGVQGDSIYWVKSPAADKFYTNGFAAGTPDVGGMVVVKGSFYSPPKAGVNVLDMTSGYLVIDPNLPDEIDIPVTYNPAKNRFTDTNNVIIELNTSTGVLNGSFISPNAKARTSFTGVVFEGAGYGFYKNTNGQTGPILISNGSNPFPALTKKIEIPRGTM
jgi:hypothetical protein